MVPYEPVLEAFLTKNPYNFMLVSNPKYRIDVIKLLQGDVYDEDEPAVLTEMRRIVSSIEHNPRQGAVLDLPWSAPRFLIHRG